MRIVVLGAGLIGISTAFFLSESGYEVIVIDRNPGPGLDTSFANGGMLTPSQAGPWNTPGVSLKLLRWLGRNDSPLLIHPSANYRC
jgi:D-amino-acid dehydrogenase